MENREKFEALPEIAEILKDEDTHWCDKRSIYINQRVFQDSITGYLNGAWYAFQEQQIKLDAIKKKLSDIYDACDEYKTVGYLLDEIQELLK